MTIIKNPLTIVQGEPASEDFPTQTYFEPTGSVPSVVTKNGDYFQQNKSNAHGILLNKDGKTAISFNSGTLDELRVVVKFKCNSLPSNTIALCGNSNGGYDAPHIMLTSSGDIFCAVTNGGGTEIRIGVDYQLTADEWYYAVLHYVSSTKVAAFSLFDESGTKLGANAKYCVSLYSSTRGDFMLGGSYGSYAAKDCLINLDETLLQLDNAVVWGQTNAKTENMGVFNFDDWNEYQEVEYLKGTGTQYINTGIVPNGNTRVVTKCNPSELPSYNGWSSSANAESFIWGVRIDDSEYFSGVSTNSKNVSSGVSYDNNLHTFDLQNGSQKLDGVEFATGQIGDTAGSGQTIYLFARHAEWSSSPAFNKDKFAETEIYSGSTKQRHYKPCYHKATGIIGFFDAASNAGRLHVNDGTGEFVKGADVN